MKKGIYFLMLLTVGFLTNCKKSKTIEDIVPIPGPQENTNETPKYLKSISVPGSEKIEFDSSINSYIVTLPQSYTGKEININLSMYDGIKLLDSTSAVTNDTTIKFSYQGQSPLDFALTEKKSGSKSYVVYVKSSGSPQIDLSSKEIAVFAGIVHFPFSFISGIGTIPESPGKNSPTVKFIDRKAGTFTQGSVQKNLTNIYLYELENLINWDDLTLEIQFEDEKLISFENVKFKRGLPTANLSGYDFLRSLKDTLHIYGGYFASSEKYTARFSNDFSSPISLEMRYNSLSSVSSELQGKIPEGSYLVNFYEGEKIIGKDAINVVSTSTKAIETIWKGSITDVFWRNTTKLAYSKGDVFYAKSSPPQFAYGSLPASSFDINLLPQLQLKNGSETVSLKPELVVVSWPLAGVSFSIGKYKVPENITSGSYEVAPVFQDKKVLKPYWSKMEIR